MRILSVIVLSLTLFSNITNAKTLDPDTMTLLEKYVDELDWLTSTMDFLRYCEYLLKSATDDCLTVIVDWKTLVWSKP